MNFSTFFRNIFGIPDTRYPDDYSRRRDHRDESVPNFDEFRKPIWNLDDEDDDDDDFRSPPSSSFGFQIFTNPLEMHRFFEHQMGEIIKSFQHEMLDPHTFGEHGLPGLDGPNGMPELDEPTPGCLGDKYLKPSYRTADQHNKSDQNLDERIRIGGLDSIMQAPKHEDPSTALIPSQGHPVQPRVFGRSVMTQTIRRPDGTVERHHTVRDNQGNQETTVTRQVGEQSYTITTHVDSDGVEKRIENFVNIDEGNLPDFEKKWKNPITSVLVEPGAETGRKPHNWFPFDKFF